MSASVSRSPRRNRFWPYDLSLPAEAPSPLTHLDWQQHARLAAFARSAARAAVRPAHPHDEGAPDMQVSLTAGLDAEQLDSLMLVLDDAELVLGAFTEEELALLEPPDDDALVPLPLVDAVPEGEARDQVLAGAFRSLLARGLVELGQEPGELFATGSLSTLLSVRSAPNSLLIVEHVEEEDPSRVIVYGLPVQTDRGIETLLMEESVAVLGHHEFVLRSVEAQATALTEWLCAALPQGRPATATRSPSPGNGWTPPSTTCARSPGCTL